MWCTISWIMIALSEVPLLGIKLPCREPMRLSKCGLIRLTRTLEMSFKRTLHKLIGQKSFKCWGSSTLGMGTIRVSVYSSMILPVAKCISNMLSNLLLHNIPVCSKDHRLKPIRARGFIRMHKEQGIFDLFNGDTSIEDISQIKISLGYISQP